MLRRSAPALAAALLLAACGSAPECGTLALSRDGRELEAVFAVADARPDARWRLVVVHEGHVAWRGQARGAFTYTHRLPDYAGADEVVVRATGADGRTCAASAGEK